MSEPLSFPDLQSSALLDRLARPVGWAVAVAATLGLGIFLGVAMVSPSQQTIMSLVIMLIFFVLLITRPILGLAMWLVLYPFVGEGIYLDLGLGLPDLTLTRFCVGVLTVLLLAQIATGRRPMLKITKADVAAFLFFLALGVSTLAADEPIRVFQQTLDRYFVPLLVYFIVRNLVDSRRDVDWLLNALFVLAFYSAIYLIYQHTLNDEPTATYEYGVRFVRGLLGGPHVFGLVFTMTLPFAVQRYFEAKQPGRRMLYLGLSGLLLTGIFFTYKRGIWVAAVISFLVIQFLHPRFRRFFFVLLLIACLVLVFGADQLTDSAAAQRFNDDLETGNNRTYMWESAIGLWIKSPIYGHGFGQFSKLSQYDVTENFYLNVLVSAGVLGLIPFLVLLLFVGLDSAAIYRQSKQRVNRALFVNWEMIAVFAGAATSYLVKAFSGNMASPLPNIIFFLLIGTIVESQVSRLKLAEDSPQERRVDTEVSTLPV